MDPKVKHYVPQWYLRNFASESARLRVLDRKQGKSYVTNVSNVAAESDYYTNEIEHLLGQLESDASVALHLLIAEGTPVKEEVWKTICSFVAAQYLRGPRQRDRSNRLIEQLVKADLVGRSKVSIADSLRNRLGREPTQDEIDDNATLLRQTDAYTVVDDSAAIRALVEQIEPVYNMLVGMFSLELVKLSKDLWFTSDDPVCLLRTSNGVFPAWHGIGIGTADQICMPLDRSHLLVLHNSALHGEAPRFQRTQRKSFEACKLYFEAALNQSYSYVYLHPDDQWLQPEHLPPPPDPLNMSGDLVEMARKIRQYHEGGASGG